MNIFKSFILFLGIIFALTACKTSDVASDSSAQDTQNQADIKAYFTSKGLTAQQSKSGAYYVVTSANPTGKSVTLGDQMLFHYVASLLNGTIIDSTSVSANKPASVINGVSYYNPFGAINEVITSLHVGEKATILLPSSLAYGSQTTSILPAYSVLKYDVTVIGFNSEIQQIRNYVATKKLQADSTASGLKFVHVSYATDSATSLVSVAAGQTITAKYTGKFLTDTQFDAGTFSFVLGGGSTVKGFDEGIAKMKKGETATIIFPSSLGYGATGNSAIPGYSPLVFTITVTDAK